MTAGRKPVVETPAFQEAVALAVTEQLAALETKLFDRLQSAPAVTSTDPIDRVIAKLAESFGTVSSQVSGRKPLAPEEVLRREAAHNRMAEMILGCRKDGADKPTYKVTSKTNLNERMIEPFKMVDKKAVNNEITWTGVPNDAMAPINKTAEAIYAAWRESTGGPAMMVPTADMRPLYVTAAGLTVKGDPPKRQHVSGEAKFESELAFTNNDPNAPEVAVLGTVAAKAKQNQAGVQ